MRTSILPTWLSLARRPLVISGLLLAFSSPALASAGPVAGSQAGSSVPRAATPVARAKAGSRVYRPKSTLSLGMVGLGKMGGNMTERLVLGGHRVVAFDRDEAARARATKVGAQSAESLEVLVDALPAGKRVVWLMLPSGKITDGSIEQLRGLLSPGDVIIEGGNSNYKDTLRRAELLRPQGIELVDVGTSGGIKGLERGYSLMIGGDKKAVRSLRPIFQTLAPARDQGWGHVGPTGAGHRAKMIHNGIEYAMMKALAEGLDLAAEGPLGMAPELLTRVWKKGSIVSSLLLDVTHEGLAQNPTLTGVGDVVPDSGEGRWTLNEAIELGVSVPVLSQAMMDRFASQRQGRSIANPLQQVMRAGFGGHAMVPAEPKKP